MLHFFLLANILHWLFSPQLGFEVSASSAGGGTEGDDTLDMEPLESMDEDGDSKDPHW